jgi:hypothetical protein
MPPHILLPPVTSESSYHLYHHHNHCHGLTILQLFPSGLANHPPVQYSAIAQDYRCEELSQFKEEVVDWAVGAGFNVMAMKSDKYVLSHLSARKLSAHRAPTMISSVRSSYVQ